MVITSLNDGLIEVGRSLVSQLEDSDTKVDAAFWLLFEEQGSWKLMIALDDVERDGPRAAYAKIQRALAKIPEPRALALHHISVLKPRAQLLKLLRSLLRTSASASETRLTNDAIQGQLISDAYVYRLH